MSIADWPPQERPRERLLAQGAGRLTDAELFEFVPPYAEVEIRG